jgi:hypothetical protein
VAFCFGEGDTMLFAETPEFSDVRHPERRCPRREPPACVHRTTESHTREEASVEEHLRDEILQKTTPLAAQRVATLLVVPSFALGGGAALRYDNFPRGERISHRYVQEEILERFRNGLVLLLRVARK